MENNLFFREHQQCSGFFFFFFLVGIKKENKGFFLWE